MYLSFYEEFDLPISEIYSYFKTPADWGHLYGSMYPAKKLKDGWYSVPLKNFPFPLVAKNVVNEPDRKVRWVFGGFWRGVGEVALSLKNGKTVVEGFEYIIPHQLWLASSFIEKHLMQKEFRRIWDLGWQRLREKEKPVA